MRDHPLPDNFADELRAAVNAVETDQSFITAVEQLQDAIRQRPGILDVGAVERAPQVSSFALIFRSNHSNDDLSM